MRRDLEERAQQRDRDAAEIARARAREQAWEELPEHRTARAQLEQIQAQRDRLRQEQVQRRWSLPLDEAELERTSRWAPRRRRDLTDRVIGKQDALNTADRELHGLDSQISELTRLVGRYARDRQDRLDAQRWPNRPRKSPMLGYLARPRAANPMPSPARKLATAPRARMSELDVPNRAPERGRPGLSR